MTSSQSTPALSTYKLFTVYPYIQLTSFESYCQLSVATIMKMQNAKAEKTDAQSHSLRLQTFRLIVYRKLNRKAKKLDNNYNSEKYL